MGIDLTQHQIDQLFDGQKELTEVVRGLHRCLDEDIRPQLKVVAAITDSMQNQLTNGLDSRVRRVEIFAAVGVALMGADKVPGLVNLALSVVKLFP